MTTDPANPSDWLLLARDRLEKADALFAQFGPSWSGVELLHEATERYLKAYLVANDWKLVKTHDLSRLLAEACASSGDFARFAPACQNLTEQFWEQHYPGGDLDAVGDDYQAIRSEIEQMVNFIVESIPKQ